MNDSSAYCVLIELEVEPGFSCSIPSLGPLVNQNEKLKQIKYCRRPTAFSLIQISNNFFPTFSKSSAWWSQP